jgi:hypothetical protein
MPRGCTSVIAINGGKIAPRHSNQNSVSLLDLRLVLPLWKTAAGVAEIRLFATGARRRMRSGDFAVFLKRADKTGAPRKTEQMITPIIWLHGDAGFYQEVWVPAPCAEFRFKRGNRF